MMCSAQEQVGLANEETGTMRDGADRCPGVTKPFVSADGSIVRVRVPGGRVRSHKLLFLSEVAQRFGSPDLSVTTRGSIQIRGIADPVPSELHEVLLGCDLFPSLTHERARNVLADPLDRTLDPLVADLDAAICADPELTELPGRFLFGLAGPSDAASILGEPVDVSVQFLDESRALLRIAGTHRAILPEQAIPEMLAVARQFLATRTQDTQWNVRDLRSHASENSPTNTSPTSAPPPSPATGPELPLGRTDSGDLVVGLPLGTISPQQAQVIASACDQVVVTPWRSLLLIGGARAEARCGQVGLITDPESVWARLSACTGAPGCSRTTSPTQEIARALAAMPQALDGHGRVHLVGCERACGHPHTPHTQVLSPATTADARESLTIDS